MSGQRVSTHAENEYEDEMLTIYQLDGTLAISQSVGISEVRDDLLDDVAHGIYR